jgi:3-oxoadipate enol-lactonase
VIKPASSSLRVKDHDTVITQSGSAKLPPLVLIHSALLDRRLWTETAANLAGARAITYDLRGHGAAAAAPRIQNLDQLADDLCSVLDGLGIGQADVAGVSMGGAIAQQFAARHQDRALSLSLIATAVLMPAGPLLTRARLFQADRPAAIEATMQRWFRPDSIAADVAQVRYAQEMLAAATVTQWASTWRALAGFDGRAPAKDIRIPVLAVAGECDISTPPPIVRQMSDAYADAEYQEIPGASHIVPLEQPETLGRVLSSFLAGLHRG